MDHDRLVCCSIGMIGQVLAIDAIDSAGAQARLLIKFSGGKH
jgi:hypothetical protein